MPLPSFLENLKIVHWCKGFLDTDGNPQGFSHVNGTLKTTLTGADGTAVGVSPTGGLKISPDINDLLLNRYVANFHGHTTTLLNPAFTGDTSIDISTDYGSFSAGDRLSLLDVTTASEENNFPIITGTPGSPTLILNKPLDKNYTVVGTIVQHAVIDVFSLAGSLGSPISYKLFPAPGVSFNIRGGVGTITMDNAGDYSAFGDIAGGITNGVVARVLLNGVFTTLATFQQNKDFEEDTSIQLQFIDNAGPGPTGDHGLVVTYDLEDWGTYVVLNGDNNTNPANPQDFFEILIQDNLTPGSTTLVEGRFKVHGYVTINS